MRKYFATWLIAATAVAASIFGLSREAQAQNQYPMGVSIECWVSATSSWVPCSTTPSTPIGSISPYQGQSAGAMQSQLAVPTSPATTLTVPSGTLAFKVCIRSGSSAINYTIDGSTPVTGATGNGEQLSSGTCVWYSGIAYANAFKAVGATAATAIDVEYQK